MRDPKYKIRGEPLDGRTVEYAHSVEGIDEVYQTFTRYDEEERYTLGDILGQVIFHPRVSDASTLIPPPAPDGSTVITSAVPGAIRPIPAWSYAMPVIGAETTGGAIKAFPIFDKFYSPDDRFEPMPDTDFALPDLGSLVAGQVGIMIGGTKEDGSIENLFLPVGSSSNLIASNNDGIIPRSTIVYDLDPESALSELDRAPLHTVWRVIRPKFDFTERTRGKPIDPVLSWQLAGPTYSRIGHGACYDYSRRSKGIGGFITVPPLRSSGKPPPPLPPTTGESPPPGGAGSPPPGGGAGSPPPPGGAGGGDPGGGAGGGHGGGGRIDPKGAGAGGAGAGAGGSGATSVADYYGYGTTTTTTTIRPTSPPLGNVIGYAGYRLGGPLFVGEIPDKHFLGVTEEGEEEYSLHLDTMTLFKRHGGHGDDFDAPLKFEGLYHRDDPLPYPKRAHIRYDPCDAHKWLDTEEREGFWRVQTESEIAGSEDYDTYLAGFYGTEETLTPGTGAELVDGTTGGGGMIEYFTDETASDGEPTESPKEKPVPRPPTCYDLLDERRKAMEKEGTTPIFDKYSNNRSDRAGQDSYRFTPFAMGFNEILGKPQPTILNSVNIRDYRTSTLPALRPYLDAYKNVMPITSRMLFFGGMTSSENEPVYTQPREDLTSRYRSGTGSGGIAIMPPEIDAADLKYQNMLGGHIPEIENSEVSETALTLLPGVRLHYGYANLESGSRSFGWNMTFNYSTGQLDHSLKVAAGTETTLLRYPSTATATDCFDFSSDVLTRNNLILKGGTGFLSTITSTPTGNNVGTIQDSSGTFAWLTDIPAGAGLWSLSGTIVYPTSATYSVAFNDTVLNHGVTDTNTGFKIGSDTYSVETGGTQAVIFDNAQTATITNQIAWKDNTAFKATLTHANSADRVMTAQDSDGTIAYLSDIPAGSLEWTRTATNLAPTNAGDTVSFTDNVYNTGVTDTNTGFKIGSDTFIIETGGQEAGRFDASQDLIIANEIVFKEGGANEGRFAHGNSANRQWNFPNSTGTVKLNTSRKNWLNSPGTGVYSYNPVVSVTAGKYGYMGHRIPDDTATISNIYIEIISTTTDASVDLDISVEYGAGAQDHATHTGSSTGTTYNLTAGRHTFIDITGICGSLAAGDIIGIQVLNNDASTTINLRGVLILETPTY